MSLTRSSLLAYLLPILAIMLLAVLLTVTLFRLADIQRGMRNNVNANMVWVIYQTHIESLMLETAIQQQIIEPNTKDDIAFRYQMLLSRINLLNDGPQQRALQGIGMDSSIDLHTKSIASLAANIAETKLGPEDYQQTLRALGSLNVLLSEASSKAMVAQWEEAGARLDMYRNAVLTILFLMIGIWLSSAFISVQLLLALKKTRENERTKQREGELQKQLESERKISELYRSFGSMVSHQFRTPLAIIDASMQRLIRAGSRMDAGEVAHRANKVRNATHRLTELIESILHADRFMEQLKVSMSPCCLAQLAQQAIAEHRSLVPDRSIQFTNEAKDGSTVVCDPLLTSQIISNLLSNSVKYSPQDTPISVRVYQEGKWLCCAVRDYGRGISAQDMPHIFKRYYRALAATDVMGTGIGLHIANELASLQEGQIFAQSEPGAGSTFTLRLPQGVVLRTPQKLSTMKNTSNARKRGDHGITD